MFRITLFLTILATGLFQTLVTHRMSHSISFLLDIQLQWLCMKCIKSGAFSFSSGSCYWFYPDRYLAPTHDEKSFKREREFLIPHICGSKRPHLDVTAKFQEKKIVQKNGGHCKETGRWRNRNRILWSHFTVKLKYFGVFIKANNYAILYCLRLL